MNWRVEHTLQIRKEFADESPGFNHYAFHASRWVGSTTLSPDEYREVEERERNGKVHD